MTFQISDDGTFSGVRARRAVRALSHPEWISTAELSAGAQPISGMIVSSAEERRMLAAVDRFAPYKTAVLVQGDSGVGKELISRAIHARGPAPNGPFITFNCSNLVESLAESQLFGHVKGAFTDARQDSLGYFRTANDGTLFLDEIGELPLKLQPKLLRAVEMHEVQPVGSAHTHKVNIRLIAATNRDLRAMVKEGSFRADLYYRLNAAAIVVPALRERPGAIPALVGHFIENYNRAFAKKVAYISRDALAALCAHGWPGNVRELSHAIESAMLMAESDRIAAHDLPESLMPIIERPLEAETVAPVQASAPQEPRMSYTLESAIDRATREALAKAIDHSYGNCVRAAELLGVSRYTVYRMINRYGLGSARRRGKLTRIIAQA